MQRSYIPILMVVGATLSLMVAAPQKETSAAAQLQAAINKETVEADLSGAIKQYAAIISKYVKSDRAVTAMALVHMAECYQKMGDAESRKIFEQVVKDYSDQKEAVALARARLGPGAQSGRPTNTLVWSGPNVDSEGRVSPDGRYLSYTDWNTGDIVLHEIATGTDRRITATKQTKPVNVFGEGSTFSRDGKQIAYNWFGENDKAELRIASLSGDPNPRRLYANPDITWFVPFDWSPDGSWLAVSLQRRDRTAQIGLIAVQSGSLRVLKSVDWRGPSRMSFSPDGKYVGYDLPESDTSQARDVFVLAIDGSREIPAVVHRGQDIMMGWSPDGKRLLFASDRTGSMDLWSLPFADGASQGLSELIKADIGRSYSLGLTRSGALYYVTTTGAGKPSTIQVASFDFGNGKLISGPADVTQEHLESDTQPTWSRDGKYLAYFSRLVRSGPTSTFVVIRSAETGQMVRELRPQLSHIFYSQIQWAHDGRSLLLQGRDFKGRWGTFQIDVQTGDLSPIMFEVDAAYPEWSQDGRSLYFRRQIPGNKGFAFIQRDLASGDEREVIRRAMLGGPIVSPDGKYIATSNVDPATNSRTKLLIPTAGGEPREMIRVSADVEAGALADYGKGTGFMGGHWAADSRWFVTRKIFNDPKRSDEFWRIPVDGSAPGKLDLSWLTTHGHVGTWQETIFRFHPDGQRIAYTVVEKGSPVKQEVWMLENFLPTLAAKK